MHPIAQGLPIHAADPGSRLPAHAVQHTGQREQPAGLVRITASRGQPPQPIGTVVVA